MKKVYFLISNLLLIGSLSAQSFMATDLNPVKKVQQQNLKSGVLLFSNTNIARATSGITSTDFGANAAGMQLTNAADDFLVPLGGGWTLDSLYAEGFTNSLTTPDSIRTIIYADNAGVPGAIISNQIIVNPDLVAAAIIPIKFPAPVSLTGGKYWISVIGKYTTGVGANTRWNWATGPTVKSDEFQLQDPAGQYGGIAWTSATVFGLADRSAYFDIFGTVDSSGCGIFDVNDLTIDSTSATSVTITISSQPTINWVVEYGTLGFPVFGPGTIINIPPFSGPDTTFIISGLTVGTVYDLYIRDSCRAGFVVISVGPYQFKTIASAPYTESFDLPRLPAAWRNFSSNAELWQFAYVSIGHSAPSDHTSGNGYFAAVDDSETPAIGFDVTLETEKIDVSGLTTAELGFWLYSDAEDFSGVSVPGDNNATITVDFYDGANWNVGVFTNTGNTFSSGTTVGWQQFYVNLGSYAITGPIAFKFIVDEDHSGGFDDDISLDDITVFEARPVGIDDNNSSAYSFELYPNPASDDINVVFNAENVNGSIQIEVLDIRGVMVIQKNLKAGKMINETIDVNSLSKGVYFVRSTHQNQIQTKKMIIK
jgi:hypothetical protein